MNPTRRDVPGLAGWLLLCFAAAGLGGLATAPQIDGWYASLTKPAWNPPSWVFGPVWTALYAMMAVAAWRVWRPGGFAAARTPLSLFLIQLALNALWSWVFFAWHRIGWAVVEIAALWLAIAATLAAFFRRDAAAGWLLVPYLAWVTFAAALTFTLWRLN